MYVLYSHFAIGDVCVAAEDEGCLLSLALSAWQTAADYAGFFSDLHDCQ